MLWIYSSWSCFNYILTYMQSFENEKSYMNNQILSVLNNF